MKKSGQRWRHCLRRNKFSLFSPIVPGPNDLAGIWLLMVNDNCDCLSGASEVIVCRFVFWWWYFADIRSNNIALSRFEAAGRCRHTYRMCSYPSVRPAVHPLGLLIQQVHSTCVSYRIRYSRPQPRATPKATKKKHTHLIKLAKINYEFSPMENCIFIRYFFLLNE